jgi:hypothetical protein
MHLMSLVVFPFVARPVLKMFFGLTEDQFISLARERKREITCLIMNDLKPDTPVNN